MEVKELEPLAVLVGFKQDTLESFEASMCEIKTRYSNAEVSSYG